MESEKTITVSISIDELQGKTEQEIRKIIHNKLAVAEIRSLFDYITNLEKKKEVLYAKIH